MRIGASDVCLPEISAAEFDSDRTADRMITGMTGRFLHGQIDSSRTAVSRGQFFHIRMRDQPLQANICGVIYSASPRAFHIKELVG